MSKRVTSNNSIFIERGATVGDISVDLGPKELRQSEPPHVQKNTPNTNGKNIGWLIWGVMLFIVLFVSLFVSNPTGFQQLVLRATLALAVGGFGVSILGSISIRVGSAIKATGGAALFVLVYWFNPAKLAHDSNPVPALGPPGQSLTNIVSPNMEKQLNSGGMRATKHRKTDLSKTLQLKSSDLQTKNSSDETFIDSVNDANAQMEQTVHNVGGDESIPIDTGTELDKEFRGRLVDDNGRAIPDAAVRCDLFGANRTKTGTDGRFTCPLSPDQQYLHIEIRAPGFSPNPYHDEVRITGESLIEKSITLGQSRPI